MKSEIDSAKIFEIAAGVLILMIIVVAVSLIIPEKEKPQNYEIQSVMLDKRTLNMNPGNTYNFKVIISPSSDVNQAVSYISDNEYVATVDVFGQVQANNVGEAKITVMTENGKQDQCLVIVTEKEVPVNSITLEKNDLILFEGESITLKFKVEPSDTTEHNYNWTSSDEDVASVNNSGEIVALKAGLTTITVKTESGKVAVCDIEVREKVTKITLDEAEKVIAVGSETTIKADLLPLGTTAKVEWKSSDESVVTIDDTGKVRALKRGTATINASVGDKSATCNIIVYDDSDKTPRSYTLNDYTWSNHKYKYWLYTPNDNIKAKKYPLVVYLGGNHVVRAYVYNINKYGITRYVNEGRDYPFYIVSPYCPHDSDYCGHTGVANYANNDIHAFVVDLINYMTTNYNIDTDRIILVGDETGASGAYFMAAKYKNMFSCLIAMDGNSAAYDEKGKWYVSPSSLTYLPIWVVQSKKVDPDRFYGLPEGASLPFNPYEDTMNYVEKLKAAGCNLKLTVLDGMQYKDTDKIFTEQETINWMISQKKKSG